MKSFNIHILYGAYDDNSLWFRFWNGKGFVIVSNKLPPLFSERHGYRKPLKIFGLKIFYLRNINDC